MASLSKLLAEWHACGFITNEQVEKINSYESKKQKNSWVLNGFIILGLTILLIGIGFIVIENWVYISDLVKIFSSFSILILFAGFAYFMKSHNKITAYNVLLFFFILFTLLTVELISQVYNINWELNNAILFGMFITAGVAAVSETMVIPAAWFFLFSLSVIRYIPHAGLIQRLFGEDFRAIFLFLHSLLLLSVSRLSFLDKKSKLVSLLRSVGLLGIVMGLVVSESASFLADSATTHMPMNLLFYFPGWLLTIVAGVFFHEKNDKNKLTKLAFILGLTIYMTTFYFNGAHFDFIFINAAATILSLVLFSLYFAGIGREKYFHLFLILVAIRCLLLLGQSLDGLFAMGIRLILIGGILVIVTILWAKNKNVLMKNIEELMNGKIK